MPPVDTEPDQRTVAAGMSPIEWWCRLPSSASVSAAGDAVDCAVAASVKAANAATAMNMRVGFDDAGDIAS